jgi:formylmethanofuran dehydrogenase subunit E
MKTEFKDTSVSDELVKYAVEFHGHLGPFLVLGLKAGLLANSLLTKDYFKTTAVVTTNPSPPSSCFIDGVQLVTGCTMGKGNIKLRKGKDVSALFAKEGRKVRLTVKNNILHSVNSISSEEESKNVSLDLMRKPVSELFEIEK